MAIRIGGMYSGLDTDALVKEMTSAYSTKKDTIQKQQTALKWKQDEWDKLNKDIYNFYANDLTAIRFGENDEYKVTSSDNKVASITNPSKANMGTYTIQVESLAQSGYLTGKELDESVSESTQISSLLDHPHAGSKFSVNNTVIEVTDDMTIGELAAKIAEIANTHASYDSTNHRFFVSATRPGSEYDFHIKSEDEGGEEILKALGLAGGGESRIYGEDAKIKFNGATYKSSNNNFKINGVDIKAHAVSTSPVNISIDSDISNLDAIKKFVNSYNDLLERMQTSYNKKSAKTYMPLTDAEKEAMSDREIEKWEEEGKENILSKDSALRTIIDLFKDSTSKSYDIDGKKMSLASIGISSGSYFSTSADKRGTLEIDEKKLKQALEEDPDKVNKLIKAVGSDLYEKLGQNSKSSTLKSVYKFYNDKEMSKQYEEYQKKIEAWDEKIAKMEDKYYKQFSLMETALAKLQSRSNALSNMFGF